MSIGAMITTIGSAGVGGESYFVARIEGQDTCEYITCTVTNCRTQSGTCSENIRAYDYCSIRFFENQLDVDYKGNIYFGINNCCKVLSLGKIENTGNLAFLETHYSECSCEPAAAWRYWHWRYDNPGGKNQNSLAVMYDSSSDNIRVFHKTQGGDKICEGSFHTAFCGTTGECIADTICQFACHGICGMCPVQICDKACAYLGMSMGDLTNPDSYVGCGGGGIASTYICLCSDGKMGAPLGPSYRFPRCGCSSIFQAGTNAVPFYRKSWKYTTCPIPEYWHRYGNGNLFSNQYYSAQSNTPNYTVQQIYNIGLQSVCLRSVDNSFCCVVTLGNVSNGPCTGRWTVFTHGACVGAQQYSFWPICVRCLKIPAILPCGSNLNCLHTSLREDWNNVYFMTQSKDCYNCACSCAIYLFKFSTTLSTLCWSRKICVPIEFSRPCFASCESCCFTVFNSVALTTDRCTDSLILSGAYNRCVCHFADTNCFDNYGAIPFIMRFSASEPPIGSYDHFCFADLTTSLINQCCTCFPTGCTNCGCFPRGCSTSWCTNTAGTHCCWCCHICPNCSYYKRINKFASPRSASDVVCITKV
jgi:hypothetical protein